MDQLTPDYWMVRGTFRIGGVLNVGTQMSLVRKKDGRFVLIDSYDDPEDLALIERETDGGKAIDAIINVHPFHTIHCRALHNRFPDAELIGTARHVRLFPDLPWSPDLIEMPETQERFSSDFAFTIPDGVDFVCQDESVHVGSVMVRHHASRIIHVDDTLNVFRPPAFLRPVLPHPRLRFHPMLGKALQKRAGAADEFERWAKGLAERWADTPVVCAAHSMVHRLGPEEFAQEVGDALKAAGPALARHRRTYG